MGADNDDFLMKVAPYMSEFFGTFFLVATALWCFLTGSPAQWSMTAIGSSQCVMVYALRSISGGYINPAVTLGMAIVGRIDWRTAVGYWLSQFSGGALAGCLSNWLFTDAVAYGLKGMLFDSFPLQYTCGVEFIYTFVLVFVFLNVTQEGFWFYNNKFFGLAIGMVIIAGGYATEKISGGCFNPAVILGFEISLYNGSFRTFLYYTGTHMVAAALATFFYNFLRQDRGGDSKGGLTEEVKKATGPRRCMGEFFGTYIIVLTVCLNILSRSQVLPWSACAAVVCMSYSLLGIAGSFNPAVSLAVIVSGGEPWNDHWLSADDVDEYVDGWQPVNHILMITMQFLGGICGGLTGGYFMNARDDLPRWVQVTLGKFATALARPLPCALTSEFFFTAICAFVFLACWRKYCNGGSDYAPSYFGLVLGLAITVGGFAAGPISGGVLNPAVTMGISSQGYFNAAYGLGHLGLDWKINALYWILAQLTGGVVGACIFRVIYREAYIAKRTVLPDLGASDPEVNKNQKKDDRSCANVRDGCTLPFISK